MADGRAARQVASAALPCSRHTDYAMLHCNNAPQPASTFLNVNGKSVHYSKISRSDIAAMTPAEYQRFASAAPLLIGEATAFLPKPGALVFGTNAAGQFLSGSFSTVTESDF